MIYLIIAGGRDFNDYEFLRQKCDIILSNVTDEVVVLCGCNGVKDKNTGEPISGADLFGEKYAKEKGFGIDYYPANWDEHGRAAGPIRNEEMAKKATHCVTFWDSKSKGTRSMIDLANKYNLKLKIVRY